MDRTPVSLCYDPIHRYIPFTTTADNSLADGEVTERQIIDHPWVQRLRHIHQLQTAWYVFPTAEHTRFQHVIGVMHLGGVVARQLYSSLASICPDVPSIGYIESLLRMAGLLHDVGHGPFGHFFDTHFLAQFSATHETLGATIIRDELGLLLQRVRRTPNHDLAADEVLDPSQIAWLIQRPQENDTASQPRWLVFLRGLLSGIYTIDNMDFVMRDAYMAGYSQRAFDMERLLHYTFFSESGLTLHDRGMDALLRFMAARSELFRTIYFHRSVQGLDMTLADLFAESRQHLFPGNPLERLDLYLEFTESSLMVDVGRWHRSSDPDLRALGERWQRFLRRDIAWKMLCQRSVQFSESDAEQASIFSDRGLVEQQLRKLLPLELSQLPIRVDINRHLYRPHTRGPSKHQNFLFDASQQRVRPLNDNQLFRMLPVSHRICRVYGLSTEHAATVSAALDRLLGSGGVDDPTNM